MSLFFMTTKKYHNQKHLDPKTESIHIFFNTRKIKLLIVKQNLNLLLSRS